MGFLGGHIQNQVATKFFDAFVPQICQNSHFFCKICIFQELGGGGAFYGPGGPRNLEFSAKSHFIHFVVS